MFIKIEVYEMLEPNLLDWLFEVSFETQSRLLLGLTARLSSKTIIGACRVLAIEVCYAWNGNRGRKRGCLR